MTDGSKSPVSTTDRIIVLVIFLSLGSLIMLVFSPWHPMLNRKADYIGRLVLITVLFVASQVARKSPRFQKFWLVLFGLFILIFASSLSYISGIYLFKQLNVTDAIPSGWAIMKINEFVVVVGTVLILNKLGGLDLKSLYIQRGNLKLGLIIGLSTFLLATAGAIPMATLFNAQNLTLS